ncbi:MAG: hypothetical protein RQ899_12885 [Pseudomonadales bacterium]|nr:hypothetical protein [Pseudomonadales bacterium]
MFNNKSGIKILSGSLLTGMLFAFGLSPTLVLADLTAVTEDLDTQCVEELGGEVVGLECEITLVTEVPFANMVLPSGKSGLGWTALGMDIETMVTVYGIESSTVITGPTMITQSVFVAGDMSLPGCSTSGNKPQKCFDHYKDVEVTIPGSEVTTYFWELSGVTATYTKVYTGCLNPGGKDLVDHKHCGF